MNKTGAWLTRYALEQLGITHTFGIPGVQNAELYDQLNQSQQITPHLVNHEMSAAFMADALSRTCAGSVGTMVVVSGSGVTHAISGIGEAYLAGIPILIIAGAPHSQLGPQLIDATQILQPLTKAIYRIDKHQQIIETLFRAYHVATSGRPGPVYIEIPVDLQLLDHAVNEPLPTFVHSVNDHAPTASDGDFEIDLDSAAKQLLQAKSPGIMVGWGGVDAQPELIALAEQLGAPVCTTLSGISSFPAQHPLHAGMLFGPAAVPSAKNAFKDCDYLLAIGTYFNQIDSAAGSAVPPHGLIYIDSDGPHCSPDDRTASITLLGDIKQTVVSLLHKIQGQQSVAPDSREIRSAIAKDKAVFKEEWLDHNSKDRVNPAIFFSKLREILDEDAIMVTDDGLHTFLAAELMPISAPRSFITPSDFNAMGYCIPAINAAKLGNPDKQTIGILGDGAMLMNGMEALTAVRENLGTIYCIFNDGKISRISRSQRVEPSQSTCTKLGNVNWGAFADAIECGYIPVRSNDDIDLALRRALETAAQSQPVYLDIAIDYSRSSYYAQGVAKANQARLAGKNTLGSFGRAIVRKLTG